MNNRFSSFLEKEIMNNMNYCHVKRANGVQTELQTEE